MKNRFIALLFLVAITSLLGFDSSSIWFVEDELSFSETTESVLTSTSETVLVKRVIDGDTIELIDGRKVRYLGIDTPETKHPQKGLECFGREATMFNQKLVEGREVLLVKDVSDTDRYGRLLRYVYVGEIFVNEHLVSQGYAKSSTYPPDVMYDQAFVKAQEIARSNGTGLWSSCYD